MSLVEVVDVVKEFKSGEETIRPLDGVHLTIEEGDFVSLMGASGSGKSTLLNLVAGIDEVNSGQIFVCGV
jgi:putative ABC transport system ATP-binding protein